MFGENSEDYFKVFETGFSTNDAANDAANGGSSDAQNQSNYKRKTADTATSIMAMLDEAQDSSKKPASKKAKLTEISHPIVADSFEVESTREYKLAPVIGDEAKSEALKGVVGLKHQVFFVVEY